MSQLESVFAVSSGSYSDYSIDAVFATEELAQAYLDKVEDNKWNFVVENNPQKWYDTFYDRFLEQHGKERADAYYEQNKRNYEWVTAPGKEKYLELYSEYRVEEWEIWYEVPAV